MLFYGVFIYIYIRAPTQIHDTYTLICEFNKAGASLVANLLYCRCLLLTRASLCWEGKLVSDALIIYGDSGKLVRLVNQPIVSMNMLFGKDEYRIGILIVLGWAKSELVVVTLMWLSDTHVVTRNHMRDVNTGNYWIVSLVNAIDVVISCLTVYELEIWKGNVVCLTLERTLHNVINLAYDVYIFWRVLSPHISGK